MKYSSICLYDGTCELSGMTATFFDKVRKITTLTIPSVYNGYCVTMLNFWDNPIFKKDQALVEGIEKIRIPNTVRCIRSECFKDFANLKEIEFYGSNSYGEEESELQIIGASAFSGLPRFEASPFDKCKSLYEVGYGAFFGTTGTTALHSYENHMKYTPFEWNHMEHTSMNICLENSKSCQSTLTIPRTYNGDMVIVIDFADTPLFQKDKNLIKRIKKIRIPNTVYCIRSECFKDFTNLKEIEFYGSNSYGKEGSELQIIGTAAFSGLSRLEAFPFDKCPNLREIKNNAFKDNSFHY